MSECGETKEQWDGSRARPSAAVERGTGWGGAGEGWGELGSPWALPSAHVLCFFRVCMCNFLRWQVYTVFFLGYIFCHGFGISFHLS